MNIVTTLKDGTVIYRNPFTETEAWFLPERKYRPSHANHNNIKKPLKLEEPQNYCAFCPTHYFETTPEKSRIERYNGDWQLVDAPTPQHIFSNTAEFRRIGNLYEIISHSYWTENFNFQLTPDQKKHKEAYLSDPQGREHIRSLLAQKRHAAHQDIFSDSNDKWIDQLSDAFFAGAHELIIPRRHFSDAATDEAHLCSAGELTPEEHFQYLRLSCHATKSVYNNNPYVKYVGVYTNWRRDAGASFEHLHRQIIGVDRIGHQIQNGTRLAARDHKIYQNYIKYVAFDLGFVLCENEHAIALVDVGHTFSSIAVYSKSAQTLPWRKSQEELQSMSDIIHAIHAAFGAEESLNEEWYYQPPHSNVRIPWYVLIRWRNHRHAGIENITDIFPDEYGPVDLKNILLGKMVKLKNEHKITDLFLDNECDAANFKLNYYEKPEPNSGKSIKTT